MSRYSEARFVHTTHWSLTTADEPVERVETAADDHHDAGEGDPAGPAGASRVVLLSRRGLLVHLFSHRGYLSVMWGRSGAPEMTNCSLNGLIVRFGASDVITYFG